MHIKIHAVFNWKKLCPANRWTGLPFTGAAGDFKPVEHSGS